MAKLYFYFSAMNAGKTTTLLQSNYNYQERGMQTMTFIPAIDTRQDYGVIASRIGLQAQAIFFNAEFNFFDYIGMHKNKSPKLKCILIDEAQFLTKHQVMQLTKVVDHYNLPVLTYGLRTDFLGEPFEGSQYLLAWAEELIEIKTICDCGSKATMNLRVDTEGNAIQQGAQIEIGGNERYISLCRAHFMEKLQSHFME